MSFAIIYERLSGKGWKKDAAEYRNDESGDERGCILNSRITWFFASAYLLFVDGLITEEQMHTAGFCGEDLRTEAQHGYAFLRDFYMDKEYGGVFWSSTYDGKPLDTTKHTYNQAFAIYALTAYYEATKEREALELAFSLFELIESQCRDEHGYFEAFTRTFQKESNEKLSENGVLAEKTMNMLLHVFEAYTQLYRVSREIAVKEKLYWILDLHSYGHDIESAWLTDEALDIFWKKSDKRCGAHF